MLRATLLTLCLALPRPAWAEVPRVLTDIGPVESLTAMVMEGLGTPDRLLPAGASPHGMALRPSQARSLSEADLIFWIGPALTPQLGDAMDTLADGSRSLSLADLPGAHLLPVRNTGLFAEDYDHDHADDHGDARHDPHLWLSPDNARLWLDAMAEALAEADRENAETYRANARHGAEAIAAAETDARAVLAPVAGRPLASAHDAFQYFEEHFGLSVVGAISDAEANAPGPDQLAALRDGLENTRPACLLIEDGNDPRLLNAVDLAGAPTATLDPLGSTLPQGATLYPALIRQLAQRIADCAGN